MPVLRDSVTLRSPPCLEQPLQEKRSNTPPLSTINPLAANLSYGQFTPLGTQ